METNGRDEYTDVCYTKYQKEQHFSGEDHDLIGLRLYNAFTGGVSLIIRKNYMRKIFLQWDIKLETCNKIYDQSTIILL